MEQPTFPIGFQWRFSPNSEIWTADLLNQERLIDFVCLPVEPSLLYGGPMSDLISHVSENFQTTLSAAWPNFPPLSKWDPIYRDSLSILCERVDPATLYFENFRPKLTELVQFESEMKKVFDAIPVLNIPLQWQGRELLWDELWLTELLRKTKLQLCLRLDQCFSGTSVLDAKNRREKIFRLISLFKDSPLRLSEIRLPVAEVDQSLWEAEVETWKEICFDEAISSSIIFVWNEPHANVEQLRDSLQMAHSLRLSLDSGAKLNHEQRIIELDQWEQVFEDVYPRLVRAIGWKDLEPAFLKFIATLGQVEWDPHETLRRWPIYLKVSGTGGNDWLDLSQFDWAQFSAQFHPAEEQKEQNSLKPQEIKINPTVQIINQQQHINIIYRARQSRGNLVQSRELAWYEAAIIDELQESSKLELTGLVNQLVEVVSPQNTKLDRSVWLKHIAEMAKSGIILYSQVE